MIEHRVLIDVSHMSSRSLDQTLQLLDQADPNRTVPLLATHTACGSFSRADYNLADRHITAIAERQGVIGLIACRHWMAKGFREPKQFSDTMDLIRRHIDHIHDVVGASGDGHRCTGFGSDQDGFIKPALPGLETPAGFTSLEEELVKQYGASVAEQICSVNALRVLKYWGQA
jgi:membrane dipeptidase